MRRPASRRVRMAGEIVLVALAGLLGGCNGGATPGARAGAAPGADQGESAPAPIPGPVAPALDLADLGGARVGLEEYRGRPVIINFWATWCEPCRREMPSLVKLNEKMTGAGLQILAVSIDAERAAVERYLAQSPLPMRILLDPAHAAADRFGVVTVPASFIVDPEGRVVERIDGEADWTNPELLATLDRIVRGRSRPAPDRAPSHAT